MRKNVILFGNIIIFPIMLYALSIVGQKNADEWIVQFWYLIVASFVIQVVSILALKNSLTSISLTFLIAAYLFHLSHIFLININYDYGSMRTYIPFVRVDVESGMRSMEISWLFIYGIFWGIILASISKSRVKTKPLKIRYAEVGKAQYGMFLVAFSLPFYLYNTGTFMYATITQGYAYAVNLEHSTMITMLSNLMLPGIILWMASCEIDKRRATYILILGLVLRCGAMLTGQRAYNLMYMAVMFLIYVYMFWRERIKKYHIIFLVTAGYLMCGFLAAIREVRSQGMSVALIMNTLLQFDKSPILNMISEFAITGNIVAFTYHGCLEPTGGMQILAAFASLIPGISYIIPGVDWSSMNVIDALDAWNWGGSFVADFYFDFHYAGIFACLAWGFLFQKWSGKFITELKKNNAYIVAWMSPILCEMFFCVRSTTYKIPRTFLFYTLIYFGMMMLFAVLKKLPYMLDAMRGERSNVKKDKR